MQSRRSGLRLMVGTFSYNEKDNLVRIVSSLLQQTAGYDRLVVIYDESDDSVTPGMVEPLVRKEPGVVMLLQGDRRGKIPHENLLAQRFLASDYDLLLHFDADVILEDKCVERMVDALASGFDMVSALSLSYPGRNLFERAVRTLNRPYEMLRGLGRFPFPLVGHSGGYSRTAVNRLFPFPEGGFNEELFALFRAQKLGLRFGIVTSAVVRFRMVASVNDYIQYRRRMARSEGLLATKLGIPIGATLRKMRAPSPPDLLARAIVEDPMSALLAPFILTLRGAANLSPDTASRDHWAPLTSTKT